MSFNMQLEAMTCHERSRAWWQINPSMRLHRILWQSLRYHDFSWASAVLMQSKLKQWKQQQTTANLGVDESEQQKRSATWRHDDRLRHMIAWSMMIYTICDYVIWCCIIGPHLEMPLATQMQHFVWGCVSLAGKCNVKMDPIISSLLNIINESFLKHGCSWLHWASLGSRQPWVGTAPPPRMPWMPVLQDQRLWLGHACTAKLCPSWAQRAHRGTA